MSQMTESTGAWMHREGSRSFPKRQRFDTGAVGSGDGVPPRQDSFEHRLAEHKRNNTETCRRQREYIKVLQLETFDTATEQANAILEQRTTLQEMTGCEWRGTMHTCPKLEMVCRADHISCDSSAPANLQALSTAWRRRHVGVREHIVAEKLSDEAPRPKPCFQAGLCTCGAENAGLRLFIKKLEQQVKDAFPTNSKPDVDKLVNGHVVLLLSAPKHNDLEEQVVFASLTLVYLRPFKACLALMSHVPFDKRQHDPAEDDAMQQVLLGEPALPSTFFTLELHGDGGVPAFLTLPKFASTFSRHRPWVFYPMELSDRSRPWYPEVLLKLKTSSPPRLA